MPRFILTSTAALALACGSALAGGLQPPVQVIAPDQADIASTANCPTIEPVVAALQAQDYTRVEVEPGIGQVRFSAVRDDTRAIIVHDCITGALLEVTGARVAAGEDLTPGVFTLPAAGADFVTAEASLAESNGGENEGANLGVDAGVGAEVDGSVDAGAGVGGSLEADADVDGSVDGGGEVDSGVEVEADVNGSVDAGADVDGSVTGSGAGADVSGNGDVSVEAPAVDSDINAGDY